MTIVPASEDRAGSAGRHLVIELRNVKRAFDTKQGRHRVLDGAGLQICEGSFTVIRGPSGAGKTTLLRILGFLDTEFSGEYIYDGAFIKEKAGWELDDLRSESIGFVFQEGRLLNHLTIGENIVLPLRLKGVSSQLQRDALEKVNALVFRQEELSGGLTDLYPNEASGGQRQRAALARAIICEPRLILADEPTASLDLVSRQQVFEKLKDLHAAGNTVIMVSHDPIFFEYGAQYELEDRKLRPVEAPGSEPRPEPGQGLGKPLGLSQDRPGAGLHDHAMLSGVRAQTRKDDPISRGQGGYGKLFWLISEAWISLIRRPLLSGLTLVTLIAGICQVALLLSVLGGVERIIDQAISDGSRLSRVQIRPRTADLSSDLRFPLTAELSRRPGIEAVIARRAASFSVLGRDGAETPYPTMGLHPQDPELRFFEFVSGSAAAFFESDFSVIVTAEFYNEIFGSASGSDGFDWSEAQGRVFEVVVPRFSRTGERLSQEVIPLSVAGVILAGEGNRQFYVSNTLLLATDQIKRDRNNTVRLPLNATGDDWAAGADLSALVDWPWEDYQHIYVDKVEHVIPEIAYLSTLGYRSEADIWDFAWVLDIKEASLKVFIPLLGLLAFVIILVLIGNIYISAKLREGELALMRVLGLKPRDLTRIELLGVLKLVVAANIAGLLFAQFLIRAISRRFEEQAQLVASLEGASPEGARGSGFGQILFSPVSEFAPGLFLGTALLVVLVAIFPAVKVSRTDPARVFSR